MIKSDSIAKIAPALLKAQKNIGAANKGAVNPFFHSTYATLGDIMEACKQPLLDEGISVLQLVGHDESGNYVETMFLHESGEFISEKMTITCAKAHDPQAQGSAISYAKRYGLQSAAFIPSIDDDGEGAMNRKPESEKTGSWEDFIWHLPFGGTQDKSFMYKGFTLKEIMETDPDGLLYWVKEFKPKANPKTDKINPKDVELRNHLNALQQSQQAKENEPQDESQATLLEKLQSLMALEQIDEAWIMDLLKKKGTIKESVKNLEDVSEVVLGKVISNWDALVKKHNEGK